MGNLSGTTEISYKTKQGVPIHYIFYDLKGKSRYPQQPQNQADVNIIFERCLQEIEATPTQLQMLKDFNKKYKYRFVVMHKRKIAEYKQMSFVSTMPTQEEQENENKSEKKKQALLQKIKEIQDNKSSQKIILMRLDKFIQEKRAQYQFIQINGLQIILSVLKKEIKTNKEGLKTNFGNQVDLLRFIHSFSSHFPKEFYTSITKHEDYGNLLLSAYHPIHVGVTSYVLSLLQDYLWRCEESKNILQILKEYSQQEGYTHYLQPYAETLENSDNILMIYYHLKFVNELIVASVNEGQRQSLREEMLNIKYSLIIQNIKARLQQNFYKLQACTFTHVHQLIFKYATKGRSNFANSMMLNPEINSRNTLNIKDLKNHIMMNLHDFQGEEEENQSDDEENEVMTAYLNESNKKQFQKYVLDVLYQIGNYLKLQIYSHPQLINENLDDDDERNSVMTEKKMVINNKMEDLKITEYIKHIRTNCIKNSCTDIMFACLKNLQYYDKSQWKKIDAFILQELGLNSKRMSDQTQNLKRIIKEKDQLSKKLLKQISQLKAQITTLKQNPGTVEVKGKKNPLQQKIQALQKRQEPTTSIQKSQNNPGNLLPPPPPPPINTGLPPPPPPPVLQKQISSQKSSSSDVPKIPNIPSIPSLPGTRVEEEKKKEGKKAQIPLKNCNIGILTFGKIENSIWKQTKEQNLSIDFKELETLFSKIEQKKEKPKMMQSMVLEKVERKQIVKLLTPERWRNAEIILTKLKIPRGELKKTLFDCSGRYCDPLVLESVKNILPTEEEKDAVSKYTDDFEDLGQPELFIRQLLQVPEFAGRIKSMIFISHKEESYFEIEHKLEQLTVAFQSLKGNYRFHHVLQISLAIGNYLNGNSYKGGAWGFKLDTLQRMQQVKSVDNKMNAAFCIVRQAWKKYQFPLFSKNQLQLYQCTSKISVSQISIEIQQLKKTLGLMKKTISSKHSSQTYQDFIGQFCEETVNELTLKTEDFLERLKELQRVYQECAKYYCEDPTKTTSDEIGKKMFSCLLFISNTQKTLKVVQSRWKKESERKAIKGQIKYKEPQKKQKQTYNVEKQKKVEKNSKEQKTSKEEELKKGSKNQKLMSRQERMKEFEKKAMEDLLKKRTTFRKSVVPGGKNQFQDIGFLKGIK